MKHLIKRLKKLERKQSLVQIFLAKTGDPHAVKFGVIKGVRKDHFLLNVFSLSSLSPTGKIAAIKIDKVERIQILENLRDNIESPIDCNPGHEVLFVSIPDPIRIQTMDFVLELGVPWFKLAIGSALTNKAGQQSH